MHLLPLSVVCVTHGNTYMHIHACMCMCRHKCTCAAFLSPLYASPVDPNLLSASPPLPFSTRTAPHTEQEMSRVTSNNFDRIRADLKAVKGENAAIVAQLKAM